MQASERWSIDEGRCGEGYKFYQYFRDFSEQMKINLRPTGVK